MQKAITRFQMFANDPYIDQGQLRKTILESDDATLVKRLYVDPQLTQSSQAEDQANEITFLRLGFPALVKDSDDHVIHIQTVISYITNRANTGAPPEPAEGQFLEQHMGEHLEKLKEADPKTGRQVEQELKNLFVQMQEAAAQQANPENVESIEEPMASVEAVQPGVAVV
jgi:DNA-directed RNA polymerase subunit F